MRTLALIIYLASTITSYCQETFFRYYPSKEYEEVYCVSEDENNNLYMVGVKYSSMSNDSNSGYILKVNRNGDMLNEQDYFSIGIRSGFTSGFFSGMSTNNLIVVGNEDSLTTNGSINRISLWTYNDELELITKKSYSFGDQIQNIPQESLLLNDSLLYIVSWIFNPNNSGIHLSILKIGLPSDSLKYFESPFTGGQTSSDLIYNNSDSTILVSYGGSLFKDGGLTKISKFDTDLNYISGFQPELFLMNTSGLCNYTDTSYLITSTTYTDELPYQHLITTEYSYNNNLINSVEIPSYPDTLLFCGGAKNTLLMDSIIWTVGIYNAIPAEYPWQQDPSWIQLNRINRNFELLDQHFYGGDAYYAPFDIKLTNDGSIIVVGSRYNANAVPSIMQKDPFVLKVNSEGLIVNVDNPEKPIAQEAIVLPNPGREYLQVKLAVQHKSADFQLFDINGRLVLEEHLQADMQRIATGQLNRGTYIYRITDSNQVIGSGKWVKE